MRLTTKRLMLLAMVTAAMTVTAVWAGGGPGVFDLTWHRIAGGGETFSTGGSFELGGTIGQHEAGEMTGGAFTLTGGFWPGALAFDPDPQPPCPGDLTGDGNVGAADLLALLACWGPTAPGCEDADLTGDGDVAIADLLQLLAQWGPCPR